LEILEGQYGRSVVSKVPGPVSKTKPGNLWASGQLQLEVEDE